MSKREVGGKKSIIRLLLEFSQGMRRRRRRFYEIERWKGGVYEYIAEARSYWVVDITLEQNGSLKP